MENERNGNRHMVKMIRENVRYFYLQSMWVSAWPYMGLCVSEQEGTRLWCNWMLDRRFLWIKRMCTDLLLSSCVDKSFNWMKTGSQMASSAMLLLHRVLADGAFSCLKSVRWNCYHLECITLKEMFKCFPYVHWLSRAICCVITGNVPRDIYGMKSRVLILIQSVYWSVILQWQETLNLAHQGAIEIRLRGEEELWVE